MAVNKRNSGTKARANTGTSANAGTKANAGATPKKKTSRITGYISDLDCYLFGAGTHYDIYQKLGAHPKTYKGKDGIYFAVWAPHAREVHLVGDFNGWNPEANPMVKIPDSGIWEYFNAGMRVGELYKFAVTTESGKILYKADPFAFSAEYRPGTASVTADIQGFNWSDADWITKRTTQDVQKLPMSIYEVHLGSWRKKNREGKDGFYTYSEAAHELAAYVKEMGYTHVELMGIAEHPFDGSWGYQVTGYFAPTSRYGSPKDFMYFVNYLHRAGIGVILDWVPAHFPKDAHGLADFDGQPLFEYADPRKGEHPDWGTKVFDYGKNEVKDFLISNALYWVEQYHVDGLRVDAVASMLYLDYGRQEGQWVPNKDGGNQNLEAIEFFKHLNTVVQGRNHGALVIAEESTAWPKVTSHPEQDGLGFTFKWNMGWMHDFLEYMKLDPYFRKYNHNRMTFGLTYPGKKLLFMGQDFGQLHEWDEKVSLDWYLAEQDEHKDLQEYVKDLLHLYKKYPALYRQDNDWNGFQWINANDADRSIFSFLRRDETGKKNLLFVINFTPVERPDYRVGVPKRGKYTLLLDSTHGAYKSGEAPGFSSAKGECDGQPYSFSYPLPAYGTAIFRF